MNWQTKHALLSQVVQHNPCVVTCAAPSDVPHASQHSRTAIASAAAVDITQCAVAGPSCIRSTRRKAAAASCGIKAAGVPAAVIWSQRGIWQT